MPQVPATPSAETDKPRDIGFTWAVLAKVYQFLAGQEEWLHRTFGHGGSLHLHLDWHTAHDAFLHEGQIIPSRELPGITLTVLTDLPIDEQVQLRAKTDALWRSSLLREQDFTASIVVRSRSSLQTAQTGIST